MAFISVRNLIVDFLRVDEDGNECLGTRALDGVSLDIEKGSSVAVVGMNGSGKSTLAKCLNGLIVPTSGEVVVDGMSTNDDSLLWDIRRKIAMVFQNPDNQIVSSIVEDDVAFGPENLGVEPEEIRERVDAALKRVNMYDCRNKGAHMLSGGQKQRIAIAGAVAMRPECIVFDEPTAMLDPQGRQQVIDIIKDLNANGITTILITHFMEEAEQADRVIVMKDATILSDSTPEELFHNSELIERAGLEMPIALALDTAVKSNQKVSDVTVKDTRKSDEIGIRTDSLRYVYNPGMPGETVALDDVSFSIRSGEICGIIGHTGSGKSTLLQHLNGLIKPTEGSIEINGQCITDGTAKMTDIRRKVGLVFQYPEYQLFEETVAKDVAFGPKNLGVSGEALDETVKKAIEIVGLNYEKIKDVSPFDLSGGMKRRVAIAGVIAMNPEVLILDEPTAGLDPKAHRDILSMVKRIHDERNITIIFVSHNMGDIAEMSDKVLVMNGGKIALEGTPREVFSHVDDLNNIGLGIPPICTVMNELAEKMPGLNTNILTLNEAIVEIQNYRKKH